LNKWKKFLNLAFGQVGEKTAFESVYNNNTQIDTTGDKNQANFLISNIDAIVA
jgi:hypothetical protein